MECCKNCYYRDKELNPCIKCKCGDKVKNNEIIIDKIRSMNDEELTEWLVDMVTDEKLLELASKNYCHDLCKYRINGKCEDSNKCPDDFTTVLEYLKTETE